MLLIALASIFSFQNIAIASAAKNFSIIFESISHEIINQISLDDGLFNSDCHRFNLKMKDSRACRIIFIDQERKIHDFAFCAQNLEAINEIASNAFRSNGIESIFVTSGINLPFFSDTKKWLVIFGPLKFDSRVKLGALVIAWDFDAIYSGFRRIEKLLFVYIFINTFVLAAVGVYQIGNITAKPMKKILKKTESFCSEESSFFNRSGSDFDQLSSSIGILVDDLSLNRKNLQAAIKELEDANCNLKKMQQEMIRAEKMASMGRLSAGLAHELGNPVGIIGGYLELLRQKDLDDSERMDFALRADAELKRIDSIIRELLDYARPSDHGKAVISAHMIIDEVLSAFSGSRAIGSIALEKSLFAGLDSVYANGDQLRQVFMNIIINASDAIYSSDNRGKGKISVITDNNGGQDRSSQELVISFSDNGCGLPENDFENVFDPFFTTKPPGKGTGLGLSVSQMIIEDMGGRIKAFRGEGCGTEIRLTLPIVQEGGGLNEK